MCACVCVHVCAWATSLLTELSRALAKTVSLFSGCFGGWFFYIEIAPTSDSLGGKRVEWDKNYLIFSVYSNYISVLFPAAPFLSAHFVQMNETADLHFLGQLCGCDVLFLRFSPAERHAPLPLPLWSLSCIMIPSWTLRLAFWVSSECWMAPARHWYSVLGW